MLGTHRSAYLVLKKLPMSELSVMKLSLLVTLTLALTALLASAAHAILVRHDTGYSQYHAREVDYPQVFYLERRQRRRICVATLIAPGWAVTAAHCTHETVLLQHLRDEGPYPVSIARQAVNIDAVFFHPDYDLADASGGEVDLALLRLAEVLSSPTPLPLYRDMNELGQRVTFVGWGFHGLGRGGHYIDDGRFRFAHNTVVAAAERLRFVFDDPRAADSAALELEGVPGLGDSGGPALIEIDGQHHVAGVAIGEVARSGEPAPRQGLYGAEFVYERLSLHQRWIDAVIAGGGEATLVAAR